MECDPDGHELGRLGFDHEVGESVRRESGSRLAHRQTAGQGLVEFALVLPLFLFMLFGLLDVGRFVYLNATLSQAAREGARLGSVEASWMSSADPGCGAVGGPVCPANVAALHADITNAVNRMMAPFGSVQNVYTRCDPPSPAALPTGTWTTQTCASSDPGDRISVRVTYSFNAVTPVISNLLGTVGVSGAATMTIN